MRDKLKDIIEYIMGEFYDIGVDEDGRGVTRLGYSPVEDEMHDKLVEIAELYGLSTETDPVGNTYVYGGEYDEYYLIGSHLDSVVNGGRYDGVIGVSVGLGILIYLKEQGIDLPIKTVAFRCEESSNFKSALIGSGLVSGGLEFGDIEDLTSIDGECLGDIFKSRGYLKEPYQISNIKEFIELHIEQGKILEESNKKIGVVDAIAGGVKISIEIQGSPEHAGATPMDMRQDSLACASEFILEVENIPTTVSPTAVATVGYIENYPNVINVVPGNTKLSIDIRDITLDSMTVLKKSILIKLDQICKRRGLSYDIKINGISKPANLSTEMQDKLKAIAEREGISHMSMVSGASHDCINMNRLFDSILIFIPCKKGISHSPLEYAKIEDAALGGELILKYIIDEYKKEKERIDI